MNHVHVWDLDRQGDMQQHSRESITASMQHGVSGLLAPGSPWLAFLASVQSLLAHAGLMLAITSGMMLINLLVSPGALWSRAILVIWLVVLVAHAVGLVIARLLMDEGSRFDQAPRVHADSQAGQPTSWMQVNGHREAGPVPAADSPPEPAGAETDPWKNVAAPAEEPETSWPQARTAAAEPELANTNGMSHHRGANGESSDRVPWRAATEIAWLRRPRSTEESEREHRESGS